MESLCFLKAINNLALPSTSVPILKRMSYSVDHYIMDAAKQQTSSRKRSGSLEVTDNGLGHLTPLKQKKLSDAEGSGHVNALEGCRSPKCPTVEYMSMTKDPCSDRAATKTSETHTVKSEFLDTSTDADTDKQGKVVLESSTLGNIRASSVELCPTSSHESPVRSLSAPGLENQSMIHGTVTSSNDVQADNEQEVKCILDDSKDRIAHEEVGRCHSLPCGMTPESNYDDTMLPSVCGKQEPVSTEQSRICSPTHENDTEQDYDSIHDDVMTCESTQNENSDSCPPTPSSCYVDIEADDDTPLSSPLNLTTTSSEKHTNSDINSHSKNDEKRDTKRAMTNTLSTEDTRLKNFHNDNNIVSKVKEDVTKNISFKESSSEKSKDKKIKFSIDAILRPDFGAVNVCHQTEPSFHHTSCQTAPSTPRNSIRSSHSAFTAVDLSTRSRSDSLSSPSCSSSSPSPPLSSASSPRHKPELNSSTMYEKHHSGQENFLFPTRFFPDPSRELENFITAGFPFMAPFPGNGLAKFPFLYTSQINPYHKINAEKEFPKQQKTPELIKSKSDHSLQSDISKLFSHSLYPLVNDPLQRPTDPSKLSRDSGRHSKNVHDVVSPQVPRPNKMSAISSDAPPHQPRSTVDVPNNKVTLTSHSKKSLQYNNITSPVKNESKNSKSSARQEKLSPSENKSEEPPSKRADKNALWPAWVFCTRYSDRPSSGPRSRKPKRNKAQDEKRPRTAFTNDQLQRLKREFEDCRYLTETRRKSLADELGLTESQIKIWFQNKRAKIKKSLGARNPLALRLMEQGLYNHTTVKQGDEFYMEDTEDE